MEEKVQMIALFDRQAYFKEQIDSMTDEEVEKTSEEDLDYCGTYTIEEFASLWNNRLDKQGNAQYEFDDSFIRFFYVDKPTQHFDIS